MLLNRLFVVPALLALTAGAFAQGDKPASAPAIPKDPAKAKAVLERVIKKLEERKDAPLSYDMEMNMKMMGMQIKMTGKVVVAGAKQRMEQTIEAPGAPGPMKMTMVSDGETIYMSLPSPGAKMIIKGTKADFEKAKKSGAGMGNSPTDPVSKLRESMTLATFDTYEENASASPASWAVSGDINMEKMPQQFKMQFGGAIKTLRLLFLKDSDLPAGEDYLDSKGDVVMSSRNKNHSTDVKIEEGTFKFAVPEGAQVMSIADVMRGNMGGAADEDEDEDSDAPASKPASHPAGGK